MKIPDIGEAIRRGRMNKGWSQKKLAKTLKVAPSTVCFWEKNKAYPPGNILVHLMDMLDLLPILFPNYHPEVKEGQEIYAPQSLSGEVKKLSEEVSKMRDRVEVLEKKKGKDRKK